MKRIDDAFQLNDSGVSLLMAGNDKAAVSAFARALTIVQQLLLQPSELLSTSVESTQAVPPETASIGHSERSDLNLARRSKAPLRNLRDEDFFLYSFPVTLSGKTYQNDGLSIYSACIILNMALAYHRQENPICIRKAETMYEMIMNLLHRDYLNNNTAVFVRIVALNNLTQIRYKHGDLKQVQDGLECLSQLIRYSIACSSILFDDELNCLFLNLLLLCPKTTAPAA